MHYIYIRLVSKVDQVMDNSPCLTIPNCWVQFCKDFAEKNVVGNFQKMRDVDIHTSCSNCLG